MKKTNKNVDKITKMLANDGPCAIRAICDATGLSADQVRRALKGMAISKTKDGRVVTFELQTTSKVKSKGTRRIKRSISSVARDMIVAGRTNEQVLATLVKDFDLDLATKRHYAAWFRARLVRQGTLTKTVAQRTAHADGWSPRKRVDAVV